MKKLLLAFVTFLATSFAAKAQTPPLNKQQTIDYIVELVNKMDVSGHLKNIEIDKKVMVLVGKYVGQERIEVSDLEHLEVKKKTINTEEPFYITHKNGIVFLFIATESDAIRLKKALEHLIDLVKTEKSTDPFDN